MVNDRLKIHCGIPPELYSFLGLGGPEPPFNCGFTPKLYCFLRLGGPDIPLVFDLLGNKSKGTLGATSGRSAENGARVGLTSTFNSHVIACFCGAVLPATYKDNCGRWTTLSFSVDNIFKRDDYIYTRSSPSALSKAKGSDENKR